MAVPPADLGLHQRVVLGVQVRPDGLDGRVPGGKVRGWYKNVNICRTAADTPDADQIRVQPVEVGHREDVKGRHFDARREGLKVGIVPGRSNATAVRSPDGAVGAAL